MYTYNMGSSVNTSEPIPVLVLTDLGGDVDDVEALAYLAGAPESQVVGIATTHMIPEKRAKIARAFMTELGQPEVPVGVGSVFPLHRDEETELRDTYLSEHAINGESYEGQGLLEHRPELGPTVFPSAEEIIVSAVRRYGKKLKIAAQAPLTDLAKVMQSHPGLLEQIGGLYIQGQATVEDGVLVPDMQAYNLSEDPEAAQTVFGLQQTVPFTLVGKFAAYQLPLLRSDFDAFEATGNQAGIYLKTHALMGIQAFADRSPDIFHRVFGVEPDKVHLLRELSKPYDALVAMAMTSPEMFTPERVGHHTLIGMTAERHGVQSPVATKQKLISTILRALTTSNQLEPTE